MRQHDYVLSKYQKFQSKSVLVLWNGTQITEELTYDKYEFRLESSLQYSKVEAIGVFPRGLEELEAITMDAHPSVPIDPRPNERVGFEEVKQLHPDTHTGCTVKAVLANGWEVEGVISWVARFGLSLLVGRKQWVHVFRHAICSYTVLADAESTEEGKRSLARRRAYTKRREEELKAKAAAKEAAKAKAEAAKAKPDQEPPAA